MSNHETEGEASSRFVDPDRDLSEAHPGIDLRDLIRVLRVRRRLILGTMIAVVALTAVVLSQLTPIYTATSVVMLDQRKNNVEDVNAVLSGLPTDQVSIQNQVQILTSRGLISRVIVALKLDQDPEFGPGVGKQWLAFLKYLKPSRWFGSTSSKMTEAAEAEAARNAVIDAVLKREEVDPVGLSTTIAVDFGSHDPQSAALISNAIAEAYVEDQLNAKFEATQKATKWLADRIAQLAQQVQVADAAVQQYKATNNLTETAEGTSLVEQQMASISGQLVAARADLAQKRASYGHMSALQRSGHSADVSQVVESPLIAQLRSQETELIRQEAQLTSKYGPNHPKMLDLQSQKKMVQAKIAEEVGHVVQTVANDAAVAAAQVSSLSASLANLESQSTTDNKLRVQLKALESKATSARSMYEAFLSRLKEAQGQEGIQTPDARILSAASVPSSPSFPNILVFMAVSLLGGALLGVAIAFIADRLDAGFRTTRQIEELLGLPVLGTIPELTGSSGKQGQAANRLVDKPMSAFAEAIRGVQLGLTLFNVDHEPKIVVVTSAVPGEGKTTVAVSLARLAARTRPRVLLIDCDLRHPMVAQTVGFENVQAGVLEALAGTRPFDECVVKDPLSNVMILPCAVKPAHPMELLASNAMKDLVSKLRTAFDLVIIDSAPILPVHDTKVLGKLSDALIFVVRWETTPREAAANALRALGEFQTSVAGIVLSRADTAKLQYYDHGYSENYKKYYVE